MSTAWPMTGPQPRDELAAWSDARLSSADFPEPVPMAAPAPPGAFEIVDGRGVYVRRVAGPDDAVPTWYIHGSGRVIDELDAARRGTGVPVARLPGRPPRFRAVGPAAARPVLAHRGCRPGRRAHHRPLATGRCTSAGTHSAVWWRPRSPPGTRNWSRTLTLISPAVPDLRLGQDRGADPRLAVLLMPGTGPMARRRLAAIDPLARARGMGAICFGDPAALTDEDYRVASARPGLADRAALGADGDHLLAARADAVVPPAGPVVVRDRGPQHHGADPGGLGDPGQAGRRPAGPANHRPVPRRAPAGGRRDRATSPRWSIPRRPPGRWPPCGRTPSAVAPTTPPGRRARRCRTVQSLWQPRQRDPTGPARSPCGLPIRFAAVGRQGRRWIDAAGADRPEPGAVVAVGRRTAKGHPAAAAGQLGAAAGRAAGPARAVHPDHQAAQRVRLVRAPVRLAGVCDPGAPRVDRRGDSADRPSAGGPPGSADVGPCGVRGDAADGGRRRLDHRHDDPAGGGHHHRESPSGDHHRACRPPRPGRARRTRTPPGRRS